MSEKTDQPREIDCGWFLRPCFGERVSGDAVVAENRNGVFFFAMIDVLGHGPEAHTVAELTVSFLRNNWTEDIVSTMNSLHSSLTGTRGAAVGLGTLEIESGTLRYAGVGNTICRIVGGGPRTFFSKEGVVGARLPSIHEQRFGVGEHDVVLLHTDGVSVRFRDEDYPRLTLDRTRDISKRIVERFGKEIDDATCLAFRYRK